MIRPEAKDALMRWREALLGAAIAMLGLWWATASFGIIKWLGVVVAVMGLALIIAGVQRARFRTPGAGPGLVTIDERRVTYLGPETGGVADLDLLARLELRPDGPTWRLVAESGAYLDIPVSARGADALFDLFAALPGVGIEHMLGLLRDRSDQIETIWDAGPRRLN